jgi:diguanylate cyclase (GGDEF)-like protein
LNKDRALHYVDRVEQESPHKSRVAILRPEILGSLGVLALSLLLGLAALYFIALAHRSEQRGALAEFAQMLREEEIGSREHLRYHFLNAESDVVAVGDQLGPGDGCPQFLSSKIREWHPDFDLPPAQDTIRRFCENRGTHVEIEPLGQLNVVLALRPVHLENGTGADIVTIAVEPVPSPRIVREYPQLLTLVILVSLLWAVLAFRWIRAKSRQLRDLARRADIDGLTGALRRESFSENLELAIKQALATATPLCIAVLDLDNLKPINDRHGHATGDDTLQQLVHIARAHLRTADLIGRLGGDEFAVLLAGATGTAAVAIAENIRGAFAHISRVGATVSIGIAELRPDDDAERIIRRADERMYAAKAKRNAVAPP